MEIRVPDAPGGVMSIDRRYAIRAARFLCRRLRAVISPKNPFRELDRYLLWWSLTHRKGLRLEGYVSQWQANLIRGQIIQTRNLRLAQVGFNAGHSAFAFLDVFYLVRLVSFDLGEHSYAHIAAQFIARRFPGRHEVVWDDSADTIPKYVMPDGKTFDLVFIDGGHLLEQAAADLRNLRPLCRRGTIVIMDDLEEGVWGNGPAEAWRQAIDSGLVEELERHIDPATGHTFAVGQYL